MARRCVPAVGLGTCHAVADREGLLGEYAGQRDAGCRHGEGSHDLVALLPACEFIAGIGGHIGCIFRCDVVADEIILAVGRNGISVGCACDGIGHMVRNLGEYACQCDVGSRHGEGSHDLVALLPALEGVAVNVRNSCHGNAVAYIIDFSVCRRGVAGGCSFDLIRHGIRELFKFAGQCDVLRRHGEAAARVSAAPLPACELVAGILAHVGCGFYIDRAVYLILCGSRRGVAGRCACDGIGHSVLFLGECACELDVVLGHGELAVCHGDAGRSPARKGISGAVVIGACDGDGCNGNIGLALVVGRGSGRGVGNVIRIGRLVYRVGDIVGGNSLPVGGCGRLFILIVEAAERNGCFGCECAGLTVERPACEGVAFACRLFAGKLIGSVLDVGVVNTAAIAGHVADGFAFRHIGVIDEIILEFRKGAVDLNIIVRHIELAVLGRCAEYSPSCKGISIVARLLGDGHLCVEYNSILIGRLCVCCGLSAVDPIRYLVLIDLPACRSHCGGCLVVEAAERHARAAVVGAAAVERPALEGVAGYLGLSGGQLIIAVFDRLFLNIADLDKRAFICDNKRVFGLIEIILQRIGHGYRELRIHRNTQLDYAAR